MQTIPILMYHNIGIPPKNAKLSNLYVHPRAFSTQMLMLKLLGYQCLSMSAAMPYLRGEKTGRVMALTFDDGYADTFDIALPILKKHGFSATSYFVSQLIGKYNKWDAAALKIKKNLMSIEQVVTWHRSGMEVGAHSQFHPRLTKCSHNRLISEIAGSKDDLESIIQAKVSQFCYPYGDYDDHITEIIHREGFDAATTTQRGRAQTGDDPYKLRRVLISKRTLPHLFMLKLFSRYEDKRG